jgi:dynein heavy chain
LMGKGQLYQRGGDLELREIVDTQFVGCTTPAGAGNNRVDPRVMTLFSVFNVTSPSREATEKIYTQILEKHTLEFAEEIQGCVGKITQATMSLYFSVIEKLPRTPVKFHYIFNLRDLSRVYEGLLQSTVDKFTDKQTFIRLWRNESMRVFCDRLIDQTDSDIIYNVISDLTKEFFKDVDEFVLKDPIIFGDYSMANPTDDEAEDPRLYEDLGDMQFIKDKLDKMLEDYSFDHKPMSLVLFNDALLHVTKIHRIIRFPKGCGLLVGFGGSGKQSLTKLATFTACYDVFTISLIRGYKESDFREDLRNLYKLVLTKPQTFLFTDSHVAEEGFLELINNILTIGMVPALFPEEEKDGLIGPLDDEMRKQKLPETKEFRWNYYVNKCRENMHIILAMSPAGDTLRVRCRNFPGLISNTNVDWFFPWPEDALNAVASNFMGVVDLEEEQREKVTSHLVMVHLSVQKFSVDFKSIYKRNNYSTPKNYLDFISNYIKFLGDKRKQCDSNVMRLEGGLTTLAKAQQDTEALSKELAAANIIIGEKKIVVAALIEDITEKSEIAAVKQKSASEKKEALDKQGIIIAREEALASKALEEAIPALTAAKEALKNIDQKALTEIKSLASPPPVIEQVCGIALFLYPKSGSDVTWATIKVQLLGDMQLLRNL